jgi:phospholipid/cholesterol/gamma-HCH transport system ATP-binding protein
MNQEVVSPSKVVSGVQASVRDLHVAYGKQEVLRGIDLEIRAGEVFVLMGPSGGGKSVFLRQLVGLEQPTSGQVLINGEPMSDETRHRFRLAMVFQSGGLLNSLTVAENVGLYLTEHRVRKPDEIARIVQQSLHRVQLPEGTSEKFPPELSGGMRKRVAIARALTMEPQLVLFDEPTAELDPLVAVAIGREILHLNQVTRATTVVVTHDRELAFGIAHRVAFLADGRIQAIGTPDEMRANPLPLLQQFLAADFTPH